MPLVIIQLVSNLPYTACGPEIQNNITITDVVSVCVLAGEFQVPECAGRIGQELPCQLQKINLRCFQNLRLKACRLAVVLHLCDLRPSERSGFAMSEKLQNERKLFAADGAKKSAETN
jgi:hypothetical protein